MTRIFLQAAKVLGFSVLENDIKLRLKGHPINRMILAGYSLSLAVFAVALTMYFITRLDGFISLSGGLIVVIGIWFTATDIRGRWDKAYEEAKDFWSEAIICDTDGKGRCLSPQSYLVDTDNLKKETSLKLLKFESVIIGSGTIISSSSSLGLSGLILSFFAAFFLLNLLKKLIG